MSDLERGIAALEQRVKESEQRASLNRFNDPEWENGWLMRRRGMEDSIAILKSLNTPKGGQE